MNVHSLNEENIKLRTKIYQLESQLSKYEKLIDEVDNVGPINPYLLKMTNDTSLINHLKK